MTAPRKTSFLHTSWRDLQSPRVLFWLLLYFMGVLVVGTVAQKYTGIFVATHLFFNSFFYWAGPFPIPVGGSVLALLFLNLFAYFLSNSQWHLKQLGTTLTHLSILILLFGGAVTLFSKQEGFMILRQNMASHSLYDYHDREFVVYRHNKILFQGDAASLQENQSIKANLPFTITPTKLCRNCTIDENNKLQKMPVQLDDEINQWGIRFEVMNHAFVTTEFMGKVQWGDYAFALRRKQQKIPFLLMLENLSQDYYQGVDIAKNYQSSLQVQEKDHPAWPVQISMNNPFRYKGYTFYQSSVLHLPNGETASVLNVVDNAGWLFPYLATGMLCAGLCVHLWVRRHAK